MTARFTGGQVNEPKHSKVSIIYKLRVETSLRDVWRAFLICIFILFLRVRGPFFRGGVKGGVKKGGSDPPPKWGSRFGVFLGVKKWSKMVKKGAGRRGKQKCSFRG